mmetsp:Transcript_14852/g.47284  ORF Transcript_14852/g.47284 Transcript_14852/m.47284 type:complete len:300 (+) Transcript_14852:914-1813(+)
MPSLAATRWRWPLRSPLNMYTEIPSRVSRRATSAAADGRMASENAMRPEVTWSLSPCGAMRKKAWMRAMEEDWGVLEAALLGRGPSVSSPKQKEWAPTRTSYPSTTAATPLPSSTTRSEVARSGTVGPFSFWWYRVTAAASGCVLKVSALATSCSARATFMLAELSRSSTEVTVGLPSVTVPVLSSTTAEARARASRAAPDLTVAPRRRLATLMPDSIAMGTPMAAGHGVAAMSTASTESQSWRSVRARRSETRHEMAAAQSVIGVKTAARRLLRSSSGALASSASASLAFMSVSTDSW